MLDAAGTCDSLDGNVRDDMLRSTWMMGVGGLDAYFSDAYAALLASTLIALKRQSNHRVTHAPIELPGPIADTPLPASIHFKKYQARDNWRWRMAARGLIEKQNYLNVELICGVLNRFLRPSKRVFKGVIDDWIVHPSANLTLFSVNRAGFTRADSAAKKAHRADSTRKLKARLDGIITRRHDCIHNCDRPKVALQSISVGTAKRVLRDIEFFVHRCDEHLDQEFPLFLKDLGFSKTTIAHLAF